MDYTTYKIAGVIYFISEIEHTAKGYQKRHILLEAPSMSNMSKGTEILKIGMFGDGCDDVYGLEEGDWVECMIKLRGRFWKKPATETEEAKNIHFQNIDLITIQKRKDPFKEKEESPEPEELSSGLFAEVEEGVKTFVGDDKEKEKGWDDLPF